MKLRFYASPCDDEQGRTYDVMERRAGGDVCIEQGFSTRLAAREEARRLNMHESKERST